MVLNLGTREMIAAIRTAQPDTGLKKLTTEVNELLPPKMRIEKHELRDFVRTLDEPINKTAAAHKPRDESFQSNIANQAFSSLREAEREFLLGLDHDSITKVHKSSGVPKCHPVAHLRYHVQVLLALKGVQPCVPFVSPKDTGILVMNEMVLRCLVPVMEELDLESYGFRLLYIARDILTTTKRFRGFKGSWVLADIKSEKWPLVRDIFNPQPPNPHQDPDNSNSSSSSTRRRVPEKLMHAAYGHPVRTDDTLTCEVNIKDMTEHRLLRDGVNQDSCRVSAVRVLCDSGCPGDWEAIMEYYIVCRDLAAPLGTVLTIDMCEHPMMDQWCDEEGILEDA